MRLGRGAHPRECGADTSAAHMLHMKDGSSPRVRGRHLRVLPAHIGKGLIPASAGQTAITGSDFQEMGAHPRECGADYVPGYAGVGHVGLIPASAGQTPASC